MKIKFATTGVCPLVPKGRGVSVEMIWENGERQYIPLVPFFEVEQIPGIGATLIESSDDESVVFYRQLPTAPDTVPIGRHLHIDSAEQIFCISGEIRMAGDGATIRPGETSEIPKKQSHAPIFQRTAGRDATCVLVWRPALKTVNVQTEVCGANRKE